jgi:2TM domain
VPVEAGGDSEQELRDRALESLKKKRDFWTHLFIYVAVNAFLVAIWAVTGAGYFWPIFVILGWGIGVVANAWDVFGRRPFSEDDIRREADRLRGVNPPK